MSTEYRVEIVAPYVYKARAENEESAGKKARELPSDGDEGVDPLAAAEVGCVEERVVIGTVQICDEDGEWGPELVVGDGSIGLAQRSGDPDPSRQGPEDPPPPAPR